MSRLGGIKALFADTTNLADGFCQIGCIISDSFSMASLSCADNSFKNATEYRFFLIFVPSRTQCRNKNEQPQPINHRQ